MSFEAGSIIVKYDVIANSSQSLDELKEMQVKAFSNNIDLGYEIQDIEL